MCMTVYRLKCTSRPKSSCSLHKDVQRSIQFYLEATCEDKFAQHVYQVRRYSKRPVAWYIFCQFILNHFSLNLFFQLDCIESLRLIRNALESVSWDQSQYLASMANGNNAPTVGIESVIFRSLDGDHIHYPKVTILAQIDKHNLFRKIRRINRQLSNFVDV